MKKTTVFCLTACVPFILVWVSFVLTGFAFSPRQVFQGGMFWGLSVMYWFVWLMMFPFIVELINEVYSTKRKQIKTFDEDLNTYKNPYKNPYKIN
jgi:hypothetical protein